MKASKPTSKHNHSNNSDVGVEKWEHPQPTGFKSKSSEAKTEVVKVKGVLRDAQEMFKKAQGVQKKVREDVKRGKESAKEPGIRD